MECIPNSNRYHPLFILIIIIVVAMSTIDTVCLRRAIQMGVSKRTDFPLRRSKVALLIVDVQRYCCDSIDTLYYQETALPRMRSNILRLLHVFRTLRDSSSSSLPHSSNIGCEVIFTAIQSLTKDGRDMSLDYQLSGPFFANIPNVNCSLAIVFLPDIFPNLSEGRGDVYIPKTSSSVFTSTNIDFVLRNLQMEQLVVVGQVTEQCVESTVRCAADLGYLVTVVDDACASTLEDKHQQGLAGMKGYCRIVTTQDVINELEAADSS